VKLLIILSTIFIVISACKPDNKVLQTKKNFEKYDYLFIGHPRSWLDDIPDINKSLYRINYDDFELLLLGGDVTFNASENIETLNYIDSLFSIRSLQTIWTLGNHDDFDTALVHKVTHRPPYHAQYVNGVTFLNTYTNDSLSSFSSNQLKLITSVCDSIKTSSHLIVLGHKLTWMYNNPEVGHLIDSIPNGKFGDKSRHMIQENNFMSDVYPLLKTVSAKGVEVIVVSGDMGVFARKFEHTSKDNIHFLASGVASGDKDSEILIFEHTPIAQSLTWKFRPLDDILNPIGEISLHTFLKKN